MTKTSVVGIDLGGTFCKLAIASCEGQIIAQDSIETQAERGPEDVLVRIGDRVKDLMSMTSAQSLAAIGMGVPGLVDVRTGVVQFLPNLHTQWRGVAVAHALTERFGCPVRLMNDVRTATLGELRSGHGKLLIDPTFAFFSIGTGIGGGVVIDGKLRLGPLGAAGELGHQTVVANGPQCGCGNFGCLESVASGSALLSEAVRLLKCGMAPTLHRLCNGDLSLLSVKLIAQAASEDQAVMRALVNAAGYIGIAAANVVSILHPELIVLGGGVAEMGELLIDEVKKVVRQRVGMFPTDDILIQRSLLGDQAGIIGAVALAIQNARVTTKQADCTTQLSNAFD